MERCYTCEEVAQRYGVKLITVWDWIRKKKLPAIKTGKCYAIRPEDIEAFERARQTVRPISSPAPSPELSEFRAAFDRALRR